MSEVTFAGRSRQTLNIFRGKYIGDEFLEIGTDLLESEDLVDLMYKIYLPLLGDGWIGAGQIADIGSAYLGGFYVPCCRRIVLAGQLDLINDRLPDHAGIVIFSDESPTFFSARKTKILPRHIARLPFSVDSYACSMFWNEDELDRSLRRTGFDKPLRCLTGYISVMSTGNLVPCVDSRWGDNGGRYAGVYGALTHGFSAALNGENDRRHLWNVQTSEALIGAKAKTPLILGVQEDHVKSLFYMRTLPMTESGRKRPILHWVRAHQRRLAEGIDIDVQKHLRGIEAFEMEGFLFEIKNPSKRKVQ